MIKCNLCPMQFKDNELLDKQIERHERWHLSCKKEKRNTAEGVVTWEIIND